MTYSIHKESTYVIAPRESREDDAAAAPQNLSSAVNKDSDGVGQGTFTIVREDKSQEVNGQDQVNNDTYVIGQKDQSHHGTSSKDQDQNGTFTIQRKDTSQQKQKEAASTSSQKDAVSVTKPVFAIPTVPARATITRAKTTVEQRESRMVGRNVFNVLVVINFADLVIEYVTEEECLHFGNDGCRCSIARTDVVRCSSSEEGSFGSSKVLNCLFVLSTSWSIHCSKIEGRRHLLGWRKPRRSFFFI